MRAKYIILITVGALAGLVVYSLYTFNQMFRLYGDRGRAYETWETANNVFKVRVTAYQEANVYLPGAYFACESAPIGSNEWREFKVFRVDDPNPIPRKLFSFVSDQVAYIYMANDFVVTVDGGQSWSVWKPILPQPDGERVYWAFKEASVEPNGKGKAKLWRYDERVKDLVYTEIQTQDFCRNWNVVGAARAGRKANMNECQSI